MSIITQPYSPRATHVRWGSKAKVGSMLSFNSQLPIFHSSISNPLILRLPENGHQRNYQKPWRRRLSHYQAPSPKRSQGLQRCPLALVNPCPSQPYRCRFQRPPAGSTSFLPQIQLHRQPQLLRFSNRSHGLRRCLSQRRTSPRICQWGLGRSITSSQAFFQTGCRHSL